MISKTKLFLALWLIGLAGVLSILLIDLNGLMTTLPLPPDAKTLTITPTLKFLSLVQPAVILSIAVLIGATLASKVGLKAPIAESAANGDNLIRALKPQIVPGIVGGLTGGIAIILIALAMKPFLSPEVGVRIGEFGSFVPILTRLLYGGITEEVLLRWGLMTLLVWAAWRLLQKGLDKPKPVVFIGAILISSIVFGLGHLPIAFILFPQPSIALIIFVIIGNSVFGLFAGYLYWKKGLESAMIAHMLAHVVLFTASYFGAYF